MGCGGVLAIPAARAMRLTCRHPATSLNPVKKLGNRPKLTSDGLEVRRTVPSNNRVDQRSISVDQRSGFLSEYSLKADPSMPCEASLGFDFEDRFDLDGRASRDLGKTQCASGMEPVGGFAVDFMEQIAATVDHKMLLVEFQGRVYATKEL